MVILGGENLVSFVRTFLSDPGSESKLWQTWRLRVDKGS